MTGKELNLSSSELTSKLAMRDGGKLHPPPPPPLPVAVSDGVNMTCGVRTRPWPAPRWSTPPMSLEMDAMEVESMEDALEAEVVDIRTEVLSSSSSSSESRKRCCEEV